MKGRFMFVLLAMLFVVPSVSACKKYAKHEIEYNFSINSTDIVLETGDTFNLVAVNGSNKVSFISEDSSIATVKDDGLVTAVAVGETMIVISAEGTDEILYCKVTVANYTYTVELAIENNYPVYVNTERVLKVKTYKDGNEYNGNVVWSIEAVNAILTPNGRSAVFKASAIGDYVVKVVGEKGGEVVFTIKVVDAFN